MIPRPHKDQFIVAGDWHGNLKQALEAVKFAELKDADTIIQVGDFGAYPENLHFIANLRHALESAKRPITLYFVDGNHENFPWLYSFPIDSATGLRPIRHNIIHLPRGTRWEWDNLSFMGVGGAPSIKKRPNDWWAEEALTQADIHHATTQAPVDVMFTHDSPVTAPNSAVAKQDWAITHFGAQSVAYCTEHRMKLAQITNHLTPRVLFHGHFHQEMQGTYVHLDPKATTAKVYGLDQGSKPTLSYRRVSFNAIRRDIEALDRIKP